MLYQSGGNQRGFGGGYSNIPIPGMAKLDATIETLKKWNQELEAISSGQRTDRQAASMPPDVRSTGVGVGPMNSGFSQQGYGTNRGVNQTGFRGGYQQDPRFAERNQVQSRTNIPIPGMAKLDAAIETLKKWNKELEGINKAKGNVNKTSQNVAVASAATNLAAKQTRPNDQGATSKFSNGGNVPHITAINTDQSRADVKKAIGNNLSGSNRDFNSTPSSVQEKSDQSISDSRGKPTTVDGSARNTDVNSISNNKTAGSSAVKSDISSKNVENQDRLSEANDIENQKKKAQEIEKKKRDFMNKLESEFQSYNKQAGITWTLENFRKNYQDEISRIESEIDNGNNPDNLIGELQVKVKNEFKDLVKLRENVYKSLESIRLVCGKSYREIKSEVDKVFQGDISGVDFGHVANSIKASIQKVTDLDSRKTRREEKKNNQA